MKRHLAALCLAPAVAKAFHKASGYDGPALLMPQSRSGRTAVIASQATRAGRQFYRISMCLALCIGALQMYRVRAGFVTNYGADLLGTVWLYAMTRLGWTVVQRGRAASAGAAALIVFALCTLSEFAQRWRFLPGRYDPYDILAFGVAVGASLGLERVAGPFVALTPSESGRER